MRAGDGTRAANDGGGQAVIDGFIKVITGPPAGAGCPSCGNLCHCTCTLAERHRERCRFLLAARLSVELACEHGFQACPICDPCTCEPKVEELGIR
jgi:hypothetical protein